MHWSYTKVNVHSGIIKVDDEKIYYVDLSENPKHNQTFVKIILHDMLNNVNLTNKKIIIECNNCSSQYKSVKQLYDLQKLTNTYQTQVIWVFGVAGHGKGEVDHVGGTSKVAVRWEITAGKVLLDCDDILDFLKDKLNQISKHIFNEITEQTLDVERAQANWYKYYTITGSSKFHVMIFTPFKASNIICVCSICQLEYGSWKANGLQLSFNIFGSPSTWHTTKTNKTLDYWSKDMLNFDFLEKVLGTISLPHFVYDFSRKMFLRLGYINWPNLIAWFSLLFEISVKMSIATVG